MKVKKYRTLFLAALILALPLAAHHAEAATLTVTTLVDENDGMGSGAGASLRECVGAASAGDIINFNMSGTITLGSEILITCSLTINGPGASVLALSGGAVRLFSIASGATVIINDLTLKDGYRYGEDGGAFYTSGTLTLNRCALSNNIALSNGSTGGRGGVIFNTGTLVANDCTFTGNGNSTTWTANGVIYNSGSATFNNSTFQGNRGSLGSVAANDNVLSFTNCTLTGNQGDSSGGSGTALYNAGALNLVNVTLANNTGNTGSALTNWGVTNVWNTVFSGNSSGCSAPFGGINDNGGNVSWNSVGCPGTASDPKLDVLRDNGGQTLTHALLPGSAAIDLTNANCQATDQRGIPRPQHGICDSGAFEANRIYVDHDATGTGTGLSWANAYTNLSTALLSATYGTELWVAEGVYKPTNVAGPNATFAITSGFQLYGGFAATETLLTQRNWTAHPTILSGDIDGNDTNADGNSIAETWANIQGYNAYHVLTLDGVTGLPITGSTVVDGFTITAGNANNTAPNERGGGLYCKGSGAGHACSPTLTNLTFSGNQVYASGSAATYGGGLFADGSSGGVSSPALTNVTFTGNRAYATEADAFGGALYSQGAGGTSSPILNNVVFTGNQAYGADNFSNTYGGAMYNNGNAGVSSPVLTNVTFINNQAASGMGEFTYGGGMSNNGNNGGVSSPRLTQVSFIGNQALYGGAMYNEGLGGTNTPLLTNVTFRGNRAPVGMGGGMYNEASSPTLINVLFSGNRADVSGGGMVNSNATPPAQPRLFNVTFSGNTASFGGALYNGSGSGTCAVTLVNSILWGNTASNAGPQIFNESGNSTADLTYTTLEGSCPSYTNCGAGMLYTNPRFVAPVAAGSAPTTTGDYHLQLGSPAVNVGDTSSVTISSDLDGNQRVMNTVVDLGAYESVLAILYAASGGLTSGACETWASACELRYALASAVAGFVGQEIWVKAGMHKPEAPGGDRNATFTLKDGVALYGGFAGTESARAERNGTTNPTFLNGDLNGDDSGFTGNGENSYHVVTGATGATLDGFTITAGNANDSSPNNSGGGMYNNAGSPTVTNVTFRGNSATSGGGMHNEAGSSPAVTNVTFSGNYCDTSGGGMSNSSSSPTLTNVTFSGNKAGTSGGGMHNENSSPVIRNSIFWGDNGSEIVNDSSMPTISDSVAQGGYTGGTNIITADPLLGTLGAYGGSTRTIPLLPGSSAIDAGDNDTCAATDQRGVVRPQGGGCDIGAFESRGFTLTKTGGDNQSAIINTAFAAPLALSVTSAHSEPVNGGIVTFTPPASGATATITGSPATISGGEAVVTATANSTAGGPYHVTASTAGAASVNFNLANAVLPDTTITEQPSDPSTAAPTFTFRGSDGVPPLGFECRLDSEGFSSCTSPKNYSGLSGGSHTFQVRVVDAAGNRDATPASYSWTVDATVPTVSLYSATLDPTNQNPITVTVTFSESVTGFTVDDIEPGNATVGNFSGSGASYSFTLAPSHSGAFTATIAEGVAFDAAGNGNTASNYFQRTYEIVKPVVDTFTVAPVSHSLAIPITAFTASDNSGLIGGYLITESTEPPVQSDSRWSGTAPATYTVGSTGSYTLYPWARDYAGNVSAVYGSPQTITVCFSTATVASNADSGPGTLRQAIADVCDNATITFSDNFTIVLASELTISKNLTIDGGAHNITVSGDNSTRVFYVKYGAIVRFYNLTIADGYSGEHAAGLYNYGTVFLDHVIFEGNSAFQLGGGMLNLGTATVDNSTFLGNTATWGSGGGIENSGTLTVTGCVFSGNRAGTMGGGIGSSGTLTVLGSTISENIAAFGGGGLSNFGIMTVQDTTIAGNSDEGTGGLGGGGLLNEAGSDTRLANVTISGNITEHAGGGICNRNSSPVLINVTIHGNSAEQGGGMYNRGSSPRVRNCILWGDSNSEISNEGGSAPDIAFSIVQGGADGTGNSDADPLLAPLGDYGGPTQTMALLPGSAALDSGNDTVCADTDQRGVARPQGSGCDIGAFESRGYTLEMTGGDNQSAAVHATFAEPLELIVTETGGGPLPGALVTFTAPASGASLTQTTLTATTDASGIAAVTVTANSIAGSYNVIAGIAGIAEDLVFNLTNVAQPSSTTTTTTTEPGGCTDEDQDGYGEGCAAGDDCDDSNPAVHDNCTDCSVRVIPKNIGWLIGEKGKIRFLLAVGERGSAFDENTNVSWNSDAIEILNKRVFMKRFMLIKVRIDGAQLDKGDYTLSVGGCTGTMHMVR